MDKIVVKHHYGPIPFASGHNMPNAYKSIRIAQRELEGQVWDWCVEHFGDDAPNGVYRWWILPSQGACFIREEDAILFTLRWAKQG